MTTPDSPMPDSPTGDPIGHALLLAYAAGELSAVEAAQVVDRLSNDPEARRVVEAYRTVAEAVRAGDDLELDPATLSRLRRIYTEGKRDIRSPATARLADWWRAARVTVAELLGPAMPQPALAGVRGEGDTGHHLRYSAAGLVIDVQVGSIDPGPRDSGPRDHGPRDRSRSVARLIGQVSTLDPAVAVALVDVAVLSEESDVPITTLRTDDSGLFVVRVPAGTYELKIAIDGDDGVDGIVALGPIRVGDSGADHR